MKLEFDSFVVTQAPGEDSIFKCIVPGEKEVTAGTLQITKTVSEKQKVGVQVNLLVKGHEIPAKGTLLGSHKSKGKEFLRVLVSSV